MSSEGGEVVKCMKHENKKRKWHPMYVCVVRYLFIQNIES